MSDKALAQMTQADFDQAMKVTNLAGLVVTIGFVVALGYAIFGLLDDPIDTQTSFTLIFVGFSLVGILNVATTISRQYLRLRKDLWDVMQVVRREG